MGNRSSHTTDEEDPKLKRATLDMIRNYRPPANLQAENKRQGENALVVNFSLIRSSIVFRPIEEDPSIYELKFEVNALSDCVVEVLHNVREELDVNDQFVKFSPLSDSRDSQSFEFGKGMKMPLPDQAILVSIEDYEEQRELFQIRRNYPLVVTLGSSKQITSDSLFMTTCFTIGKSADGASYTAVVAAQKLHLDGQSWTLYEIYGLQRNATDSRHCVVCLTEDKDTAMLPCRHLCLCCGCAKVMRSQLSAKCPICRTAGNSFLQIKIE